MSAALGKIVNSISQIHRPGGSSTFYPSTLNQQTSYKSGWLRKLGGVVKSWHRRWVCIKGDQLYYFSSEDATKPLGSFFLPGFKVNELPFNINDPDKFPFELVPGGDRVAASDVCTFCANTEDERKDWMRVIRQVIYAGRGGAIFGQMLDITMAYEAKIGKRKVPEIVEMCVDFLTKHGLETEGLFRLPGRSSQVKELREAFDCCQRPTFSLPDTDIHTVASLLKSYLRDLPQALIPCQFLEPARRIATIDVLENKNLACERMTALLSNMPMHNYNLLQYLCQFLSNVASNHTINKMNESNLATIFSHSVIRPEIDDPAILMGTSNARSKIVELLLTQSSAIFRKEYTADGEAINVDTLISFDDVGNAGQMQDHHSRTPDACNDLMGLSFTSEDLAAPLEPASTAQVEEEDPYATYQETSSPEEEEVVDPYAVYTREQGTQLVGDNTEPPATTTNEGLVLVNPDVSKTKEVDYATVNYRPKRARSLRNRVGAIIITDGDTPPDPPPRAAKRTSLLKPSQLANELGESLTQRSGSCPDVLENLPTGLTDDNEVRRPLNVEGTEENGDSSELPVTTHVLYNDRPQDSTMPEDSAHNRAIPEDSTMPQGSTMSLDSTVPTDDVSSIDTSTPPISSAQSSNECLASSDSPVTFNDLSVPSTTHTTPTDTPKVDYDALDTLFSTNISDMDTEGLHGHITSLTDQISNLRARVACLETERKEMRSQHTTKVQAMARKLDEEKTATADAVSMIVRLKTELQSYHMKFGNLDS